MKKQIPSSNPQVRWIENVELDYLGRVESIDKDFQEAVAKLGLKLKGVPHVNRSAHATYIDYYCDESLSIVETYYQEDFERLGYPKEKLV